MEMEKEKKEIWFIVLSLEPLGATETKTHTVVNHYVLGGLQ